MTKNDRYTKVNSILMEALRTLDPRDDILDAYMYDEITTAARHVRASIENDKRKRKNA